MECWFFTLLTVTIILTLILENEMNKQKIIDYVWDHINKSNNERRKAFNRWKNDSAFFYAGIVSNENQEKPYSCLLYIFSDKDVETTELKSLNQFRSAFGDNLRYQTLDDDIRNIFKEDIYKIPASEIPEWEFRVGKYQELLDSEVLMVESLEELKGAIADYSGINEYDLCELYDKHLDKVKIERIYEKTDDDFKYGEITSRISYNGEVIGHFNRSGKWMETYTYYTHDLNKWKEMLEYIMAELGIKRSVDEYVIVFDKAGDLYDYAHINKKEED